jgi:hypothetical protein
MMKRLNRLWNNLIPFKKAIPTTIAVEETTVRIILCPSMLTKGEKSIRTNAYKTPSGKDEVSIIRLDYSSEDFCKKHGKNIQKIENNRRYFGFGVLKCEEILSANAEVVGSPKTKIPAHGDIKIGYIPKKVSLFRLNLV